MAAGISVAAWLLGLSILLVDGVDIANCNAMFIHFDLSFLVGCTRLHLAALGACH